MKKQATRETESTPLLSRPTGLCTALFVGPNDEDRVALKRIIQPEWTVIASTGLDSALSGLRKLIVPLYSVIPIYRGAKCRTAFPVFPIPRS